MKTTKHILKIRRLVGAVLAIGILAPLSSTAANAPVMTDQGTKWTDAARNKYYTQDQGSRVIPLKWINALKQADGAPFMADNLSRYGYLPNPKSPDGLPVGFVATNAKGGKELGLTCSACHTREIDVSGSAYRIDGGPAIIDIQSFFSDLDTAVNTVLTDPGAFAKFAQAVLGSSPKKAAEDKLRTDVAAWFLPYDTIMKAALPTQSPWGPSRLDAVSMIFNRLSGLDIGPAPTYIIKENIKLADAPVRYPFLWNAPIQDRTQWPGFSANGDRILGLSRNLGEVIGVFAVFHPQKDSAGKINYVANNSANFHGLNKLESLVMKLGPPKWPWALDAKLVAEGEQVFNKKDPAQGDKSCTDCHGITKGTKPNTWATPILDVGTDSREVNLLGSEIKTGVLEGATLLPGQPPLKAVDKAFSALGLAVSGSIFQHYQPADLNKKEQKDLNKLPQLKAMMQKEVEKGEDLSNTGNLDEVKETYKMPAPAAAAPAPAAPAPVAPEVPTTPSYAYESRVLQGIWAAAPYLHNGSVPTLTELLTPSANRVAEFKVGPAYDTDKVGLAVEQTKFNFTLKTTDCSDRNSGDSRCGHDYGTGFTDVEKKALLEYLKSL